jgi:hypothetical protein
MAGSLTSRTLARPSFETAFEPPAFLRAMLAFESALAAAQAEEGTIPHASARTIAAVCEGLDLDVDALVAEAKRSATLVVPLVNSLRAAVGKVDAAAAKHVHFGATTQDVLDTAMALCLKPCLEEADRSLEGAVRALARRALEHRATPMLGRTLMQPAIAMSAGVKIARWALALAADRERLADSQAVALAIQCGGPIGTQQGLGARGIVVRKHVARRLGLADATVVASASQRVDRPARSRGPRRAHRRKDRARPVASHAAGGRRDARDAPAGGRGRFERDAAQAKPGRLRARACRGHAHAGPPRDAACGFSLGARARPGRMAGGARARSGDRLRPRKQPRFPRYDRGRARRRCRAHEGEPRNYGAPGTTAAADEPTMEELLSQLGPYLT